MVLHLLYVYGAPISTRSQHVYTPACCQVVQDKANWGVLGRLANFTYTFAIQLKVRGHPCAYYVMHEGQCMEHLGTACLIAAI
jgi:hypothetical protein